LKVAFRSEGSLKSNVSNYLLELVASVYRDACNKCIAEVSDLRDLTTIRARVKEEGVGFLTLTLPVFGRDFEQALQLGRIDPIFFRSFRKSKAIPAFLRGMLGRIFDRETGRIYEKQSPNYASDCPTIVDSVRQICLSFQRIEMECDPEKVTRSLQNFVQNEQSLKVLSVPNADAEDFISVSAVLWDNSMANITSDSFVPRHGPGATAEHISGNQKYVWLKWHERLEPFFPFIDTAYPIGVSGEERFEEVSFINQELEQPVRIVTVPKTLKGPRIIAIEPSCMQYVQQAIRRVLYATIESAELSKGHVNFRDQSVNQRLALVGSSSGQLATIDLSDASDRVPRSLAMEMFRANPDLRDSIDACRSTRAMMPDGAIIAPLAKFASMGSALCFPVESMYFYTVCVVALLKEMNLPVSHANVFEVTRDVYVYGDDIIVPKAYAISVLDYLQKYNCKVNMSKTFLGGSFRESCGTDAFDGELVTPVYVRRIRPENRRQVEELISWVASGNAFYKKGYWNTAQLMWHTCERYLGSLPYVSEESSALGRISFLGYRTVERWNRKLQRFEVKAWVPGPVYRSDSIDGYPALQKCLLLLEAGGNNPFEPREVDPLHLERTALHNAVALKRCWVPST
jgi:hypothetical protein